MWYTIRKIPINILKEEVTSQQTLTHTSKTFDFILTWF